MKCPKCGGEVCENDSFCEKCGTILVSEKAISYKKLVIIAFLVCVFFLGFWMIASSFTVSPQNLDLNSIPAAMATATVYPTPTITSTPDKKIFTNSIGMEFILIPAGEFDMGSPWSDKYSYDTERPIHHVKIASAFYMGKYEITQKQWSDVMGTNPSFFKDDTLPVEQVSWDDVQQFITKLNAREDTTKYRLPLEAEWEYAARAGTTTKYSFGDDESKLGDYAWYDANSNNRTHPIGQKNPNPWGLYDIHGNVWEWVQDTWNDYYVGFLTDGSSWEIGSVSSRVIRSGSWYDYASRYCRSAARQPSDHDHRGGGLGFRLVMVL